jgi:exopolysaccharide production protein ExoZ
MAGAATVTISAPGIVSSSTPSPRGEIISVQYLRGLAAVMVVVYHMLGFGRFGIPKWQVGNQGVDIFFVISGFIMWTTAQKLSPRRFLERRLVRLVPLYWFFTLLMAATSPIFGGSSFEQHRIGLKTILLSLFFIPFHQSFDPTRAVAPILGQGWTLNYEMVFYVSFALALFLPTKRARASAIFIGLGLLCVVGWIAPPVEPLLYVITSPIMIEFLFGIAVAAIVYRLPSGHPRAYFVLLLVAWLLLIASGHAKLNPGRSLVVGLPAATLVLAAIALEQTIRLRPVAVLRSIGDASYALYLCHGFALNACALFLSRLPFHFRPGGLAGFMLFLVIGLPAAILAAVAVHEVLEKPLTLWLNKVLGLRRAPARQLGVSSQVMIAGIEEPGR